MSYIIYKHCSHCLYPFFPHFMCVCMSFATSVPRQTIIATIPFVCCEWVSWAPFTKQLYLLDNVVQIRMWGDRSNVRMTPTTCLPFLVTSCIAMFTECVCGCYMLHHTPEIRVFRTCSRRIIVIIIIIWCDVTGIDSITNQTQLNYKI